jgi:hypothetical protein
MLRLRLVDQFQRKIGSLPQIGRDVVKIRWTYGDNIFVVRGTSALGQCETGDSR